MPIDRTLPPAEPTGHLWWLTADGWQDLGPAAAEPRTTNALALTGDLQPPQGYQNRWLWLAYEGHVYRALYLSHFPQGSALIMHLKLELTYTNNEWTALAPLPDEELLPTADQLRVKHFGESYEADRSMFIGDPDRINRQ